jgi:hypothetical protein
VTLSTTDIDVFWIDGSNAGTRTLRHRNGQLP